MEDFDLRDRPDVVFVKPANDLLFFMSSIPDTTQAYLREKEMLHLSLDELAKRWKWTRDISPAMREHSGFFESIPAMQRAAGFYA